jgi:hypothetical protein
MEISVRAGDDLGDLTLKIKFKKENRGTLSVETDVKTKIPKPATERTLFFPDEATGDLHREDPKQPPLRNVPLRPTPLPIRQSPSETELPMFCGQPE